MGFDRGVITAVLLRPALWLEAVRTWSTLRRRGGVAGSQVYVGWRMYTAYGDHSTTASAQDVLNYLQWRREMRTIRKWERVA
jgi:hypothetical protein